jgi:hypothetical protein
MRRQTVGGGLELTRRARARRGPLGRPCLHADGCQRDRGLGELVAIRARLGGGADRSLTRRSSAAPSDS